MVITTIVRIAIKAVTVKVITKAIVLLKVQQQKCTANSLSTPHTSATVRNEGLNVLNKIWLRNCSCTVGALPWLFGMNFPMTPTEIEL